VIATKTINIPEILMYSSSFTVPVRYKSIGGIIMKKSYLLAARILFLFIAVFAVGFGGCYLENNNTINKEIVLYSFTSETNTGLTKDYAGVIAGTDIVVVLPQGTGVNGLVATFTTSGTKVIVGNTVQTSGVTPNNFTNPVTYTVYGSNNTTKNYTVMVAFEADDAHDTEYPEVVYTNPGNGEIHYVPNSIIIVFNKAMNPSTFVLGNTFTVNFGTGPVQGSIAWDMGNRRVTFTPSSQFEVNTEYYTVTIAGMVTDNNGIQLGYDYLYEFSIDLTFPTDTTPPVAGNSGTITTGSVTDSSVVLNWTAGTDNITGQLDLQYAVYQSGSNNITTVVNCESNGMLIQDYTVNITTKTTTGLSASTTYYFNVIVKDSAGNKASYTMRQQETAQQIISVTGMGISKYSIGLLVAGSETLRAFVYPRTSTNQNVTWFTSNDSIVSVNTSGLITGVSAGTASVTVTAVDTTNGTFSATCSVTVSAIPVPVTGLSLAYSSPRTNIGGKFVLNVRCNPSTATDQRVTWTNSNPSVATVDSIGRVTGVTAGSTTITATAVDTTNGTFTASVTVTVGNYQIISGSIANFTDYPFTPGMYLKVSIFNSSTDTWVADISGNCRLDNYGNFLLVIDGSVPQMYLTEVTSATWPGCTVTPSSGVFMGGSGSDNYYADLIMYSNTNSKLAYIYYADMQYLTTFPNKKADINYSTANVTINGSFTSLYKSYWEKAFINNITFPAGWSFMVATRTHNSDLNTEENPYLYVNANVVPFTNQEGFKFYGSY
jgi:uncharacterized protein YjdB